MNQSTLSLKNKALISLTTGALVATCGLCSPFAAAFAADAPEDKPAPTTETKLVTSDASKALPADFKENFPQNYSDGFVQFTDAYKALKAAYDANKGKLTDEDLKRAESYKEIANFMSTHKDASEDQVVSLKAIQAELMKMTAQPTPDTSSDSSKKDAETQTEKPGALTDAETQTDTAEKKDASTQTDNASLIKAPTSTQSQTKAQNQALSASAQTHAAKATQTTTSKTGKSLPKTADASVIPVLGSFVSAGLASLAVARKLKG